MNLIVWQIKKLTLYNTIPNCNDTKEGGSWRHCATSGKFWYQGFSPFPTTFSILLQIPTSEPTFYLLSINAFDLHMSCQTEIVKLLTITQISTNWLTLYQTSPGFYMSAVQVFWKDCWKRRKCSLWAISPFPTVFSTHFFFFLEISANFHQIWYCRLQTLSVCRSLKLVVWERVKWLLDGIYHRRKLMIKYRSVQSKIRLHVCAVWSCSTHSAK